MALRDRGEPWWCRPSAATSPRCRRAAGGRRRERHRDADRAAAADWNNSTILGPYSAEAIRDLKDRVDGGMCVSGSATLVRALLADGLAGELHLFVFPLALGTGQRLFAERTQKTEMALAGCETYTSGALHHTYAPATTA